MVNVLDQQRITNPLDNQGSISISAQDSCRLAAREYDRLASMTKEQLIRLVMGDEDYFKALSV